MVMKSFRGKIADGDIDTVPLSTNNGSTGYKIVKFEVIGEEPMGTDQEAVIKIYSIPQTKPTTNTIDFSDNTLLAVAFYENDANTAYFGGTSIIFDNTKFNQDIYITNQSSTGSINYYIELEQVKLDLNENTVATLKDIRNIKSN
jgi:hypothetical protein